MSNTPLFDESLEAWLLSQFDALGIDRSKFNWDTTIALLKANFPRRLQSSQDLLNDADIHRKIVTGFKRLGIRRFDTGDTEIVESAGTQSKRRVVLGAETLQLRFDDFFRSQLADLKLAQADEAAVYRRVVAYVDAHPDLGLTVAEIWADLQREARGA